MQVMESTTGNDAAPATSDPVQVERDAGVATVWLDRPEALNAFTTEMKQRLLAVLEQVAADDTVRCVVLTGTGRAFSAGQDLTEHASKLAEGDLEALWNTVPQHYNPIALAIHRMTKPVLAAVNGIAAGAGASIAFLADYRIVSASAGFNLAFGKIGLSCDTGCSYTLPRLVGYTRAMDLLLNPRTVGSEEALALGIASEVVADDEFADRVRAYAAGLAAGPTRAYAALRRCVGYAAGHNLEETLEFEAAMMKETGSSADHQNAVQAFRAKQHPTFTGE